MAPATASSVNSPTVVKLLVVLTVVRTVPVSSGNVIVCVVVGSGKLSVNPTTPAVHWHANTLESAAVVIVSQLACVPPLTSEQLVTSRESEGSAVGSSSQVPVAVVVPKTMSCVTTWPLIEMLSVALSPRTTLPLDRSEATWA